MDKQRLAEIMYELDEGKEELVKSDVSFSFMLCENGTVARVGAADYVGEILMISTSIMSMAEKMGTDIVPFMAMLTSIILEGQELGVVKGRLDD